MKKKILAMVLSLLTIGGAINVSASPLREVKENNILVQAQTTRAALLASKTSYDSTFTVYSNKSSIFPKSGAMSVNVLAASVAPEVYIEVIAPTGFMVYSGFIQRGAGTAFDFTLQKGNYIIKAVGSNGARTAVKVQLFG